MVFTLNSLKPKRKDINKLKMKITEKKIILASSSPRRISIFKALGLDFVIEKANVNERPLKNEKAKNLVQRLAKEKALKIARKYQNRDCLIIGFDTTVELEGKIFGKPKDKKEAFNILKKLNGKKHFVYTGIAIVNPLTKKIIVDIEKTAVYFRQLSKKEIKDYVASNEPMGKAGAYAIQEKGAILVKKINGDFYNVVGLPINKLIQGLKEF